MHFYIKKRKRDKMELNTKEELIAFLEGLKNDVETIKASTRQETQEEKQEETQEETQEQETEDEIAKLLEEK
jgi:hypothetical protein|nr:MAG TPA: hypothetical protein [Caudoviricetes sp.]